MRELELRTADLHTVCLLQAVLPRLFIKARCRYATKDIRKASVHYNRLWSITEPIPNRPHPDAKLFISTPLTASMIYFIGVKQMYDLKFESHCIISAGVKLLSITMLF